MRTFTTLALVLLAAAPLYAAEPPRTEIVLPPGAKLTTVSAGTVTLSMEPRRLVLTGKTVIRTSSGFHLETTASRVTLFLLPEDRVSRILVEPGTRE